jgi:hypothetical protein
MPELAAYKADESGAEFLHFRLVVDANQPRFLGGGPQTPSFFNIPSCPTISNSDSIHFKHENCVQNGTYEFARIHQYSDTLRPFRTCSLAFLKSLWSRRLNPRLSKSGYCLVNIWAMPLNLPRIPLTLFLSRHNPASDENGMVGIRVPSLMSNFISTIVQYSLDLSPATKV